MNTSLITLEIAVAVIGLLILLADLWVPAASKVKLGYIAASLLFLVLFSSFTDLVEGDGVRYAFGGMYVQDQLALYFKRFFIAAAIIVLVLTVEYSDRIKAGISEFYSLTLFALAGMMFAASANDFSLLFVSLELVTVTFYVLTSFLRSQTKSLESGVKYLILGALSSAFMVYGIALVFGTTNTMNFNELQRITSGWAAAGTLGDHKLLQLGLLMVFFGLAFKIAAFPMHVWAPDVYQGAPTPATAFLAVGSKAAGFVLVLRVLFGAAPAIAINWTVVLMIVAAITILYGNLCAIPQRNLKRLLGYSSISNAGYILLGVAAASVSGSSAVLYYLTGYLFTVLAAFGVLIVVVKQVDGDDISSLSGLSQRSPFLAATMTIAMVSLAGIPPLAGFVGKFLLVKAVAEQAISNPADPIMHPMAFIVIAVAIAGVVMSLYYYFGVVRAIYWSKENSETTPIEVSYPVKAMLATCVAAILYLGLFPGIPLTAGENAVSDLKLDSSVEVKHKVAGRVEHAKH
ncbi:MAG TPA: NADH-quinone oxidoreductase subunit N [Verrucomicrobiae bacterium]